MRGLSAEDIVRVWERGAGQHPIDRALTVLAVGDPGGEDTLAADLPLGERNRRLLEIRARTFGDDLEALAVCAQCGERIELRVPAREIVPNAGNPAGDSALQVRKLTSRDLAAVVPCGDLETARRTLAARAIEGGAGEGRSEPPMPEAQVEAIARRLYEIDPLALLTLVVRCPSCAAQWECELDAAEYLWNEIEAEALRVLREVHTLAVAYGWRESDILAMSRLRRRAYLELVQ